MKERPFYAGEVMRSLRCCRLRSMLCLVVCIYLASGACSGELLGDEVTSEEVPPAVDQAIEGILGLSSDLESYLSSISRDYARLTPAQKTQVLDCIDSMAIGGDAALRILSEAQEDVPLSTRFQAIMIAKKLGFPEWREWLCSGLRDADGKVRARAVTTLGFIGDERDLGDLLHYLEHDSDERVRLCSASAIGLIGQKALMPGLVTAVSNAEESTVVRLSAARALLSMNTSASLARRYLMQVTDRGTPDERRIAVLNLLTCGDVQSLRAFVQTSTEPAVLDTVVNKVFTVVAVDLFDRDAMEGYVQDNEDIDIESIRNWLIDHPDSVIWSEERRLYTLDTGQTK